LPVTRVDFIIPDLLSASTTKFAGGKAPCERSIRSNNNTDFIKKKAGLAEYRISVILAAMVDFWIKEREKW
jgi:hypothetical protein